jgi:predicted metal-dependent hydrolase
MRNIWDFLGLGNVKKIYKKSKFTKIKKRKTKSKIIIKDGVRYRVVRIRKKLSKKEKEIEYEKYLLNKENARKIVLEKLIYWQEFYRNLEQKSPQPLFYKEGAEQQELKNIFGVNLEYKKVFIKNVTTRWGSCSSKKNLNFSYKIVFLENSVQDYLIVHELCHLKEMNHKESFWNLVALAVPDYLEKRKALKNFGIMQK